MPDPIKFVDELPDASPERAASSNGDGTSAATIRLIVALGHRPGVWAEVGRTKALNPAGSPYTGLSVKAGRWREYGLDAEVRREGDEIVMYARFPAVAR